MAILFFGSSDTQVLKQVIKAILGLNFVCFGPKIGHLGQFLSSYLVTLAKCGS